MAFVEGSHHVTLSVGGAQEDVDFHVNTLGMRFIKRTVLFDGSKPIYHLYYSNANGDPSSVVTTFPWAQAGLYGKRGTNQAREVLLSVPAGSLDFWHQRLNRAQGARSRTSRSSTSAGWPSATPPASSTCSSPMRTTSAKATPAMECLRNTPSTASTAWVST